MFNKTKARWLAGAALTLALGGALLFTGNASAQTATPATPGATATTPLPTTPGQAAPGTGVLPGGHAGGEGFGGRGGHGKGPGGPGGVATADGAANAISMTTQSLALVKSDLTYATGKMDTASVQQWLTAADNMLAQATAAQTNQQYGQAGAYAETARSLANTAELVMAQTLGADKLPSYGQQPQRGLRDAQNATQTPTQAQVSRDLQHTYNELISQGALVGTNADAKSYLTQAQEAYKTAYTAYQAGDYPAARNAARLAQSLLRVSDSLLRVTDAGISPDAPVTVPAPTF
jgi:hypothetical protein